jgi:hypothetical protein
LTLERRPRIGHARGFREINGSEFEEHSETNAINADRFGGPDKLGGASLAGEARGQHWRNPTVMGHPDGDLMKAMQN